MDLCNDPKDNNMIINMIFVMYGVTESPLSHNDRFPGENNYWGIVSSL